MRKSLLRRPSPALAVAFLALLVALGGTSYAALSVPKNSVGTKQLKNKAVTASKLANGVVGTAKIKNGVVTASKINTSGLTVPNALYANSAGSATKATTATTATNAAMATTATSATNAGNSTDLGGIAASAYQTYGATLPSGDTETGVWGGGFYAAAVGNSSVMTGSFPVPLAAAPNASHVIFASGSATDCPGRGQADPGYLCVYLGQATNADTPTSADIYNPEAPETQGAGANGFAITVTAGTAGEDSITGSFAVTAP